jgi:hypothetical protein
MTAGGSDWHAMPEPYLGLDVRVYWSREFQVYEVVFRNRTDSTLDFLYWTNASDTLSTRASERRMPPFTEQSPPGASAGSAQSGELLCVTVRADGTNSPMRTGSASR